MRRTQFQRQEHRWVIEEGLVTGHPPGQIVRAMVEKYALTPRQAWHDLHQVQAEFRRQDDELRQDRWKLADLAVASDRCDREFLAALQAGDARRAMRVEKHRCKLLGIYHADRCRTRHSPLKVRLARLAKIKSQFDELYTDAPRNADGSVVLTAFSFSPPRPDDERYRQKIEAPLARGPSPRRRERIDAMRAVLAAGGRMDQLEAAARKQYGISSRQVRADVRTLQSELEQDGYAMHQGSHEVQLLPLALRRRARIAELALHPQCSHLAPRDEKAAEPTGGPQRPSDSNPPSACGDAANEATPTTDATMTDATMTDGRAAEARNCATTVAEPASAGQALAARAGATPAGPTLRDGNSPSELPTKLPTKPATKPPKPKLPDVRLAADVEIDRCRLLGLYSRERPHPHEENLLWLPPQLDPEEEMPGPPLTAAEGRIDNPSYAGAREGLPYGRPLCDFTCADPHVDRMLEEEFARRDARQGLRHTVAELLLDPYGQPGREGRAPWKPREEQSEPGFANSP